MACVELLFNGTQLHIHTRLPKQRVVVAFNCSGTIKNKVCRKLLGIAATSNSD